MCRNLKPLFNFFPPATEEEIHKASLQFVRKISGFVKPSKANQDVFHKSVKDIMSIVNEMLNCLVTKSTPKNREIEAEKTKQRFEKSIKNLQTSKTKNLS